MTPISRALLEQGHYIMVVTNGTVFKRFDEILQFPKTLLDRLGFKLSFQYLELKRLGIIEKWFENVKRIKDAGCSISVELTPVDEIIPDIPDIQDICLKKLGALCHVTVARDSRKNELPILTSLSRDDYKKTWSVFGSPMFDFKLDTFNVKRKEFCYAGLWSGVINFGTGILKQCYKSPYTQNIFDNPDEPINFMPVGHNCLQPHCFNSHAWLTLGLIPSLKTPSYSDMRDRKCEDGTSWLTESMRVFLAQKLYENNVPLDIVEQKEMDKKWKMKYFLSGLQKVFFRRKNNVVS
jgi:hypothetical protein